MDDGVLASRGMTEAVIKKSELKAKRVKGRKKLNERQQHKKKKITLLNFFTKVMIIGLKKILKWQ